MSEEASAGWGRGPKMVTAVILGVIGLGLGFSALTGDDQPDQGDAAARNACSHFRNVAGDADLLTADELRSKLQEVNDSASVSDDVAIRNRSRDMLAAITRDDPEAFDTAATAFGDACRSIGH